MDDLIEVRVLIFKPTGKFYCEEIVPVNKYKSRDDAFKDVVEYLRGQFRDKVILTTDDFFGCPYMQLPIIIK